MGLAAAVPASADTNGCPSDKQAATSDRVGAHTTTNGTDVTYYFDSFVDATDVQSGDPAVPGLIEYCVYPDAAPTSVTTVAVGNDGSAWGDPPGFNNFSWNRQDGNPSNILYDGQSNHEMGTASYDAAVPAGFDTIVLHINDRAECENLYPGTTDEQNTTCFVAPGTPTIPPADDLTISKTASGSYVNTYAWTISKDACKHGTGGTTGVACVQEVKQVGGNVTFDYTVKVTRDGGTISNVKVTGSITVTNPNAADVTIDSVTDQLSNGTDCPVTGGSSTIPANDSKVFSYSCDLSTLPSSLTNTATVKWSHQVLSDGSTLDASSATTTPPTDVSFTGNDIDECVNVTDPNSPNPPLPANVCDTTTFNYSKTVAAPQFDCTTVGNTAKFTTNDSGTPGEASQSVKVCGPAKTGALTMGFWQNKNGQSIITGGASVSNVCKSGTWLRQYAPFQDLSVTATCAQVATYVTSVIKSANASGSSMNAMLKAQMLATALDVYFSDSSLGGNKINAPSPVGSQKIDLTLICKMIDGSGGTATCSGTYQDTSSVFGGSPCQTVLALLTYAASQSSAGGSSWYGQVKATQEKAKNTFDAINNQVAFGC
jgi:hypothetical protein